MKDLRIVERWDGNKYVRTQFELLKKDDTFRMFDPNGKPVVWDGETEFRATGNAYEKWFKADRHNDEGLRWTIDVMKEIEYMEEQEA